MAATLKKKKVGTFCIKQKHNIFNSHSYDRPVQRLDHGPECRRTETRFPAETKHVYLSKNFQTGVGDQTLPYLPDTRSSVLTAKEAGE
jgi:hypothetical protein